MDVKWNPLRAGGTAEDENALLLRKGSERDGVFQCHRHSVDIALLQGVSGVCGYDAGC